MEFNKILVRYGEIGLKSKQTRRMFENKLQKNMENFLQRFKIKFKIDSSWGRFMVETKDERALDILKNVFGIVSISPVISCKPVLSDIRKTVLDLTENYLSENDSFAVRPRRAGNHSFKSEDIGREVGADIVKKIGSDVDLDNPDKEIFIEARQNEAYVFTETIPGPGGLPYGVEGSVLAVHTSSVENLKTVVWLMAKRGCEIEIICSENDFKEVEKIREDLNDWFISLKIHTTKDNLYSAADHLIQKSNLKLLVGTELLTEKNLKRFEEIDKKVKLPVLRPLIGLSEENLSKYKKKIKGLSVTLFAFFVFLCRFFN